MLNLKSLSVKTGIKQKVLTEIRDLAVRHGINRVVLFGSRARGDFRDRSDIDLAVSGGNDGRFRLAVEEETSTLCILSACLYAPNSLLALAIGVLS